MNCAYSHSAIQPRMQMPMGGYYGNSFPIRQKKNSVDRTHVEGEVPNSGEVNTVDVPEVKEQQ